MTLPSAGKAFDCDTAEREGIVGGNAGNETVPPVSAGWAALPRSAAIAATDEVAGTLALVASVPHRRATTALRLT